MKISEKEQSYLEGSLMPEAKFLQESYILALHRYKWVNKFTKNKIILDAGCGSGYGTDMLISGGAKKVYGVDINSKSIEFCKKHYSQKNLVFSEGDLEKLKFPDKFFDCVVAFEVIEHVQNCPKALAEFYRILKPGGVLVFSTPNKKIYSPGTKKPFYPFHYQEFYLEDIKTLLKKFQIQEILGQYIKGKKMLLYPSWHPKRNIRVIYANLPFEIKIVLMRWYLKVYAWIYRTGLYRTNKQLSDVYFSKNLDTTRIFVVRCTRQKRKNNEN
ncbi:class I SAM-dependent methyltransferase [Patescibacteria group bacterium]